MTFDDGTWAAELRDQSDTTVDFRVESHDNAGNTAETDLHQLQVKTTLTAGVSLSLLLLVIILLSALIGSAIYLVWRRNQLKKARGRLRLNQFLSLLRRLFLFRLSLRS